MAYWSKLEHCAKGARSYQPVAICICSRWAQEHISSNRPVTQSRTSRTSTPSTRWSRYIHSLPLYRAKPHNSGNLHSRWYHSSILQWRIQLPVAYVSTVGRLLHIVRQVCVVQS